MTVETANRMKYMFLFTIDKAVKICCCSLKIGSYIFMILNLSLSLSLLNADSDESVKTGVLLVGIMNLGLSVSYLISMIKFNFQFAYFCWMVYTFFTYIYSLGITFMIIFLLNNVAHPSNLILITPALAINVLIMLYFNYIIYSVTKTIGLGQRALLDGNIRAMVNPKVNSNLMGNNYQHHNYQEI